MASEAHEPGSESGKRSDAPQEGGASSHSAARPSPRSPGSGRRSSRSSRTSSAGSTYARATASSCGARRSRALRLSAESFKSVGSSE